jgi:branched-chain amino acid aminotransferase
VSPLDRGFLYADGVFEVLRTYRGAPFMLDAHLDRLSRAASRIGLPFSWAPGVLADELRTLAAATGNTESHLRVVITRGVGDGVMPTETTSATRVLVASPLAAQPRARYAAGEGAITVSCPWRSAADPTAGAKTLAYLAHVLWTREARARGAHEALVLGADGCVIEGATSNVFVLADGAVLTPPLGGGALAGVTRAVLLDALVRRGVDVREAPIAQDVLRRAREVFITSSVREVVPLTAIDGATVGEGTPGPMTRTAHRVLREVAGVADVPMPWE